mgnify:CR=1 FL=1
MVIIVVVMIMIDDHRCMSISVAIPMVVIMIAPVNSESDRYNKGIIVRWIVCLLYTSDAADE